MKKHLIRNSILGLSALTLAACNTGPMVFNPGANPNPALFQRFGAGQMQTPMQVVELRWQHPEQIAEAAAAGLDIFGAQPMQRIAKARISQSEEALLQSLGIQVQPTIEVNMDRSGLPSGYMTYTQMVGKLQALAQQYPQLVTLEDVGDTHLKRSGQAPNHDIWAVSLTNKQISGHKPTLMLTAGVHARELAPVELVMKLAEELASKYGQDPQITQLMDTREVVLLPMVNVDGRVEVEKGDSWKRKNMNTSRGDGVDLNRNFDARWNYEGLDVPSSWKRGLTDPRGQTYSGTSAASEIETQVVQNMYKRKRINASMDIHAYGEMFFWPLGFQREPIPEVNQYRTIFQNTFARNRYQGGTSLELLYATSGTTDDYGYVRHGAFSMGLEVGKSFRPSYAEVENMWRETRPSWLGLIQAAGTVQKEGAGLPVQGLSFQNHVH